MSPRYSDTTQLQTEALLELYELNLNPLGISQSLYFCKHALNQQTGVSFNGNEYQPVPILGAEFGLTISNAEEQPRIQIADIEKLVSAVVQQAGGDLAGALIKRTRVFRENLDDGADPDVSAAFPTESYVVDSQEHNSITYTFNIGSLLNFARLQIPRNRIRKLLDENSV